MTRKLMVLLIFVLLIPSSLTLIPVKNPDEITHSNSTKSLASSPWPMFHNNLRHTGLSPHSAVPNERLSETYPHLHKKPFFDTFKYQGRRNDIQKPSFEPMEMKSKEPKGYTSHGVIRINNDTDFANQASQEGWPGDGSQSNPYVISGYDIDAHHAGDTIYIGNTTVYFVVENCYLHNATYHTYPYFNGGGIILYNVTNGKISGNNVTSNWLGVDLLSSNSNTISGNNITNNEVGISIYNSTHNTLSKNKMNANTQGLWVYADNINGFNQSIDTSNLVNGKPVYYYFKQYDLNLDSIDAGHITIAGCYNFRVSNLLLNHSDGIYLRFSGKGIVENFNITNSATGIITHYSSNITIKNGKIWNLTSFVGGIQLQWSSWIDIEKTEIYNSSSGIVVGWDSNNNTITDSYLHSNRYQGLSIFDSNRNHIKRVISTRNGNNGLYLNNTSKNTIENSNFSENVNYHGISMDKYCNDN